MFQVYYGCKTCTVSTFYSVKCWNTTSFSILKHIIVQCTCMDRPIGHRSVNTAVRISPHLPGLRPMWQDYVRTRRNKLFIPVIVYFHCVLLCAYIELLFHQNIYCNYYTQWNNESWNISFKISCSPGGLLTSFTLLGDFFKVYYAVPPLNSSLSKLVVTNIILACFFLKNHCLYHIFLEG